MTKTRVLLSSVAFAIGLLAAPTEAHAVGPIGIELGAKVGYGDNPTGGDPNPLGLGIGGRGGVTFMNIYAGVDVRYYFGGSANIAPGASISAHSVLYGIEAGYGFTLVDILTIRPQLGIGNLTITAASVSASNLYLEPGVTALVSLGEPWFVGGDVNLLVLPGISNGEGGTTTDTAFTLHAQVGVKF